MLFRRLRPFFLPLLPLALSACGGQTSVTRDAIQKPLEGSLVQNVETLVRHERADPCDRKQGSIRAQIAEVLDAKARQISQVKVDSKYYQSVKYGPLIIRKLKAPFPRREDPIYEYTYSWKNIIKHYQRIANTAVSTDWAALYSEVRGILGDDRNRILYGAHFSLGRNDGAQIKALWSQVKKCQDQSNCLDPELSTDLEEFAEEHRPYHELMTKLRNTTDRSEKRKLIKEITEAANFDSEFYLFEVNPDLKRTSETEFTLPLNGVALTGALDEIKEIVETMWSTDQFKLHIQWAGANETPSPFRLILRDGPSGRSYVSFSDRTVNLFQQVRAQSIAHEIGHTLGFADHYYTLWDPETCEYTVQGNEDDLMSDSDTGAVTSDEWAELQQRYPLKMRLK